MKLETITANGQTVAVLTGAEPAITDVQSALDVMMAAKYEAGSQLLAIEGTSAATPASPFRISSGRATGEAACTSPRIARRRWSG